MENIQPVLYAIINLHLRSEPVESLAPALVDNIGKFLKWVGSIELPCRIGPSHESL
jgi:hypothetical protein